MDTEAETFTTLRNARRRAFVFQAGCWVVGIALGLTAAGAVILAVFAQLGVFQ